MAVGRTNFVVAVARVNSARIGRRLAFGLLAGVLVAAAAVLPGAVAATRVAASTGPLPYVGIPLHGLSDNVRMVVAKSDLVVSDATHGDLRVYRQSGALLHTITGLPGPGRMLVADGGSRLYVTDSTSDTISVVSTSSWKVLGRLHVDDCPMSLALAGGRLFYSWGCGGGDGTGPGGVASISTSGGTPVEVFSDDEFAPLVTGEGSRIAIDVTAIQPSPITTYSVGAGGTVTELASFALPGPARDMAFSPNGSLLYTAGAQESGVVAWDPATGAKVTEYPGIDDNDVDAMALSPSGSDLATGFSGYGGTVNLVTTSDKAVLWARSLEPALHDPDPQAAMLPGTMAFSGNGALVFGLAISTARPVFLFASVLRPKAGHVTVKVGRAPYGKRLPVTIEGPRGGAVTLSAVEYGLGQPAALGTVRIGAAGRGRGEIRPTYSGTVTASFIGSAAFLPAEATATYTVASFSRAGAVGGHRKGGIVWYSSPSSARPDLVTKPAGDRPVVAVTYARSHGRWVAIGRSSGTEDPAGVYIKYKRLPRRVQLEVKWSVGSTRYSRGSKATSPRFEVS